MSASSSASSRSMFFSCVKEAGINVSASVYSRLNIPYFLLAGCQFCSAVSITRCVCNIDCSGYSFNPVCASDGSSYNNPCFVREASCLRQEQIDIRHLGHCSGRFNLLSLININSGINKLGRAFPF